MSADYEKLSNRRATLLITMAIGFMVWLVLPMNGMASSPDWDTGVSMIGWLVWVISLALLFWTFRKSAVSADMRAALDDELVKANRAEAFRASYIASALGAVSLYILTLFVEADGAMVARIMLGIVVTAPMLSFAAAEKKNA